MTIQNENNTNTQKWNAFLEEAGAIIEDGNVIHFGNPVRETQVTTTGSIIADLSHIGLISAQGEDVLNFLQGQLTNDIHQVSAGHSQLSGYCSPKGRLLATFRIFFHDNHYYLALPKELLEPTLKRLKMYILMSKVTLEDASNTLTRMGCAGPDCESTLQEIFGQTPENNHSVSQSDDCTVIRIPGPQARFEIIGPLESIKKIWSALDVRSAPVGKPAWSLLDILAGIPVISPETIDAFVPQMVNWELLGGISFKKGCYTGQEIVARLHYRGKVKRRMYLAHVETDQLPTAGDDVFSASDPSQSVGTLVSAQPAPDGGMLVLAVIMVDYADTADLHLSEGQGPALSIKSLPYPLIDKE